jgi:hypothetical protein
MAARFTASPKAAIHRTSGFRGNGSLDRFRAAENGSGYAAR